jgi:hypothetical protein
MDGFQLHWGFSVSEGWEMGRGGERNVRTCPLGRRGGLWGGKRSFWEYEYW